MKSLPELYEYRENKIKNILLYVVWVSHVSFFLLMSPAFLFLVETGGDPQSNFLFLTWNGITSSRFEDVGTRFWCRIFQMFVVFWIFCASEVLSSIAYKEIIALLDVIRFDVSNHHRKLDILERRNNRNDIHIAQILVILRFVFWVAAIVIQEADHGLGHLPSIDHNVICVIRIILVRMKSVLSP